MSTNEDDKGNNWRPKHRQRMKDGKLVQAFLASGGQREVLLYHERICDLIDIAGENRLVTSLYALSGDVLDAPPADDIVAWTARRSRVLTALRDAQAIVFEGDADLTSEIEISLLPDVYKRWHVRRSRGANGKDQPRTEGGKFAKKPAHTGTTGTGQPGTATAPNGTVPAPEHRYRREEKEKREENEEGFENASARPTADQIDAADTRAFTDAVTSKLTGVITGADPAYIAQQLLWASKRTHSKSQQTHPLTQWLAAVDTFLDSISKGSVPKGDPVAYIIGMVPTAGQRLEVASSAIGSKPTPTSTAADALADMFSADELATMAGQTDD